MEEILIEQFLQENFWIFLLIILWTLPWKGFALWRSARNNHLGWFVVLLVVNSLAVLEIFYIFIFGRNEFRQKLKQRTLNIFKSFRD